MPILAHKSLIDAAGKSVKKSSSAEQVITGVVNGGAKITAAGAGAVERATAYSKRVARKDNEPAPKKAPSGWRSAFEHAYKVVTNPDYAKRKALENTKEHHRQLAPVVNPINKGAKRLKDEANDASARIEMKHGAVGRAVSKTAELLPEVLTAGASIRAKVANSAFGVVKDFGEGKSVAGAIGRKIFPGNTKLANVASNAATDIISE